MMLRSSPFLLIASLLAAIPANADGLYTKNSPVLQVNHKNYDQLIAHTNYTSVSDLKTIPSAANKIAN